MHATERRLALALFVLVAVDLTGGLLAVASEVNRCASISTCLRTGRAGCSSCPRLRLENTSVSVLAFPSTA